MHLFSLPILALSFFVADVVANPHGNHHAARRAHDAIARRAPGDLAVHQKRFDNARWTFYDVGLGACGINNVASDFIVALNSAQFGGGYPGPNCFKQITMTYNGQTTTATITDECPGCPYGGLDLSRGLFTFFAPESAGVIYGTWDFVGDAPAPAPSPTPQPVTTDTPTPTPTPTTTQPSPTPSPSTTSTWTDSSSTDSPSPSSQPPPSSSSSPSSVNYSSGVASNLAVPTSTTIQDGAPHNILGMNQAIVGIGGLVVAGEGAQ